MIQAFWKALGLVSTLALLVVGVMVASGDVPPERAIGVLCIWAASKGYGRG